MTRDAYAPRAVSSLRDAGKLEKPELLPTRRGSSTPFMTPYMIGCIFYMVGSFSFVIGTAFFFVDAARAAKLV
jgi:hypothetical protein